jgi:membrane-associated phospholipid phosphatase
MKTATAPRLVPLAVGIAALLACSERPTAPTSAPSLGLAESANRGESDKGAAAAATLAWEKTTRDLVVSHRLAPTVATRLYALHSMAQYAAVVAVTRGRDDDDDRSGGRAAYEARRGAIAGASVQLLSAILTDAAPALEAQLAAYGQNASGRTHRQFTRGVAIGRTAGNAMIEWAKNDGFSMPWNESMRNAPGVGIWEGAAAVAPAARPAPTGYQFPTMTPYFLRARKGRTAQSQFRPPSPPAYLSTRFNTDLAEVRAIALGRTQTQTDIANFWNISAGTVTTLGYWDEQAALYIVERGLDEEDASHLFALMNAAVMDATIGCWDAKFFYLLLRPTMADPTIKLATGIPGFPYTLPNHPSYPSGHSCVSAAAVTVLSRSFPAHTAKLSADVIEAGLSRIYGGIHYRFDIDAGQTLGHSAGEWAIEYDRRYGLLRAVGLGERKKGERDRR